MTPQETAFFLEKTLVRGCLSFCAAFVIAVSTAFACGCVREAPAGPVFDVNIPPFVSWTRKNEVTGKNSHFRALGPFIESWRGADGSRTVAVRPFWSMTKNGKSRTAMDFLWPLAGKRDLSGGSYGWAFPYYCCKTEGGLDEELLFPLFFRGIDKNGRVSWYVFPFGGKLHKFFSYDELSLIGFPLFWRGRKGDSTGIGVLWPLFGRTSGGDLEKLRIFPFYAHTRIKDLRDNVSYMWPFYNSSISLKSGMPGYSVLIFPFAGWEKWGKISNLTILWPLFSMRSADSEYVTLNCPWPFFKYGVAKPGVDGGTFNIWPFFGTTRTAHSKYVFCCWPSGLYMKSGSGDLTEEWLCVLPFYWSMVERAANGGRAIKDCVHIWPFYRKEYEEGAAKRRSLSLLPVKSPAAVERNYAPFLHFFESCSNEKGSWFELFWGFAGARWGASGSAMTIGPFYSHEFDSGSEYPVKTDIFSGLVRTAVGRDGATKLKLFYFLEF